MRLAEKKHQRDLQISQRARSASPAAAMHQEEDANGPYLERNYDYYELYTMPERYMYRVAHPEPYKLSGTVPCNNLRHDEEKLLLEVSGLSKVTRARQERQRSASPATVQPRGGSVSSAGRSVPQQSTPSGSILRTFSADHAMQMSDLGSGVNLTSSPPGLASSLAIRTDSREGNYAFPTDSRGRNVSRSPKPRAHSPTFSPNRDYDGQRYLSLFLFVLLSYVLLCQNVYGSYLFVNNFSQCGRYAACGQHREGGPSAKQSAKSQQERSRDPRVQTAAFLEQRHQKRKVS